MILAASVAHQHQQMLLEHPAKLPPLLQSVQSLFVFDTFFFPEDCASFYKYHFSVIF